MKSKSISLYYISIAIFILMICRCSVPDYSLPNTVTCTTYQVEGMTGNWQDEKKCMFTCPDTTIRLQLTSNEYEWSQDQLIDKYCTVPPTATSTATATATVIPSATATPKKISGPMLTGDVTLCDIRNGVINLRIVDGYDMSQVGTLETTIGGYPASCMVNPGNASIYTCNLPASIIFPAQIVLKGDGSILNDFLFDGSSCIVPEKEKEDEDGDEPPPPAPTFDCSTDPSNPNC
jgi:hypothetical protein